MALLTKTGPGGTELLVRSRELDWKKRPNHKSLATPAAEDTAFTLRQAVEQALYGGSPEQLEKSLRNRLEFWVNTCRQGQDMRTAPRQVRDLHRQHGWLFAVPSHAQVQQILDALDSAVPGWDTHNLGLFYRTLEHNFPQLLRVCRAQCRS
jgi:hypothetical protein